MKKLISLMALVGLTTNAHAITSEFTFDVQSSGPDIYVCNAGIKHVNPAGNASDTQGNGTVTTDDSGEYLQDVIEYKMGTFDIWTSTLTDAGSTTRKRSDGSNNYVTATGFQNLYTTDLTKHKVDFDGANEKNKVLTYLKFELSTERFGTEYFIDVCYYGPRFHSGPVGTHFVAKSELTFASLYNNNYRSLSGLLVKGELYCDGVLKKSADWTSANVSAKTLWSNHSLGGNAPGKCVTRYYFKENSLDRRPNGKHGARVKVKTTIVDPSDI
ncbi:MAG: hypothetical protein ACPGJV_06080 [Bacteriovoracaceae bacterium]